MADAKVKKQSVTLSAEERAEYMAQFVLDPSCMAANTLQRLVTVQDGEKLNGIALEKELKKQSQQVVKGDLTQLEEMLVVQARTLDTLFGTLTTRAAANMGEYTNAAEIYLRLALKAQSQSRTTVETLAAIKNPPLVIATQANVTTGPQQVNNTITTDLRAKKSEPAPTEQSGDTRELLPDTRAPGAALAPDLSLATVGEVHRAADGSRQGEIVTEPLARRTA
ncbi:MAG: hypothetical protein FJ279_30380 [Planctomycetes bacterium]|nr:hypothetical protein [Planctomycetota bacterium]